MYNSDNCNNNIGIDCKDIKNNKMKKQWLERFVITFKDFLEGTFMEIIDFSSEINNDLNDKCCFYNKYGKYRMRTSAEDTFLPFLYL